ncbi:hypothetical protein N7468_002394 [Penicillium chermesinum]|uniref:Xylanolytic transcriptional activator regulatory domain-containing protein n=1 Tax=Penicillium chermesinum TaxID=63820 RepID=A0A9W9PIF0_9EURO|nr:uncharacterized protein N7468_002394 [Penicillium chermesinum]KAJ5247411.1 hypothetical protein N7468_002394 [Penicillium chermesinum]
MFIRHCICYTPETFSIQNELCQQAEAYLHASNPRNAIDSGLKALNATSVSPDHDIATPLLHAYFDTWERVYCVVHKDTFWKEYYDTCIGIRRMSLGFRVLALAMMVLGQRSIDHDMPSQNQDHSERLSSWIECVEHYCYLLIDNQRLDLLSLQTICLFALYKGTTADRKEARTWIQRLAKIAVHARLHRDPSDLDAMSDFDKQLRRRLWASIVEIDIQVALEQGTSIPWVQNVDYDVDVYLGGRHTSRPTHLWPGCELQNALYESAKDRIAFLHATVDGTFCEKNAEDSARTLSRTLGTLDSICVSFSMVNSAPEPRILLRLHVLRPLLKAMQIIIFQLNNSDQIRETMTIYHKHALEFLRLYLKLSTSSRNGSLLSSTLFEVLSPSCNYTQMVVDSQVSS